MKKIIASASIISLLSCGGTKLMPVANEQAREAAIHYPGVTASSLQRGRTLFINHCQKCHSLKAPDSRTEKEWSTVIPRMAKKAKIDADTERAITQYLYAFSKKT